MEVEKYLEEEPKETLGDHCGLQKNQFPNADLLTDRECKALTRALEKLYAVFNLDANVPKGLPVRVRYTGMVNVLDEKVFLDWFGITSIEHCHYDYEGVCPFGVSSCDCRLDWASDVENIMKRPQSEWFDTEALEVIWYELMNQFDKLSSDFEQVHTPHKVAVQKLLGQLAQARRLMQDATIYFKPDETEMPDGDFLPFLEALGVGKVIFPKVENLKALEFELLTIALHFLFGKGYHSEHFVEWSLERQYLEFVAHWSQWGKLDDDDGYFLFKMQPKEQTLLDKARKASKYKSHSDYVLNLVSENNESSEDTDELPF